MRDLHKIILVFDVCLRVAMVLIGYNRHEPNILRSFWDSLFAGTIKTLPNLRPVRVF